MWGCVAFKKRSDLCFRLIETGQDTEVVQKKLADSPAASITRLCYLQASVALERLGKYSGVRQ